MRKDGNNRMQNAGKTAGKRAGDNDIPGSIEWYAEKGEDEMEKNPEQYGGIYKELADLLGDAAVIRIWKNYAGLSVTFPMRLYSREYIREYIREHCDSMKPSEIGRLLGLSERRVRQLIHELREAEKDTENSQSSQRKMQDQEE